MHEGKSQLRILVVEDEAKVARALREGLEREKYKVVVADTGEEAFYLVNAEEFDLVILDLMLPGRDGLQVLSTLRKRGLLTPVLILTARDAVENRVQGLDQGADDYLVKPFAFPELLARTRALLRRGRTQMVPQLPLADLEMDVMGRRVRRAGKDEEFTNREFELLESLLRHKEQVVSREMLARDVWRETSRATPLDSVIEVHMSRLRHKIDEPFDRKLISHDPGSWVRVAGGTTMRRPWPRHVRSRMTLWYVLVLGVLLLAYAGVASSYLFFSLREQLDHDLLEDSERVEGRLENSPDGMVTLASVHHGEDEASMPRF